MRLTTDQQQQILRIVRQHVGSGGRVRVYGSRLRDDLRGGDIDLMIEGPEHLLPLGAWAAEIFRAAKASAWSIFLPLLDP